MPVNYYTVIEAARSKGEVDLGYRLSKDANDPLMAFGVVLNPVKSKEVIYSPTDHLIVLAEQ